MEENRNVTINVREECPLPKCCAGSTWLVRDSKKRMRDLGRRGFSSYPRTAVCSKCGNVKYFDAGSPDEDYQNRRKNRLKKMNPFFEEEQKMRIVPPVIDETPNMESAQKPRTNNSPSNQNQENKKKFVRSNENRNQNQTPRKPGNTGQQKHQNHRKPAQQKNEEN